MVGSVVDIVVAAVAVVHATFWVNVLALSTEKGSKALRLSACVSLSSESSQLTLRPS